MDAERFADHLAHPRGLGHAPGGEAARDGVAGGAACGDLIRFSLLVVGDRVADAGFVASGCGSMIAAGSAAVELVRGAPVLEVARVSTTLLSDALGGLSPGKLHAADLVADALHSALGAAVRASGSLGRAPQRTLVAMSGGVDSAVAALLVARAGREAVGVTLELWRDPENDAEASCCSADAVRSARALAHRMGLAHLTLDLRSEFREGVVDPWLADHAAGLTPNPCVRCNGRVRLDAMLDYADRLGAPELATGHYARTRGGDAGGPPRLRVAADPAKDQSYMLAGLAPASLARLRFPLGELAKPQVRALAAEAALPVASKPDSQDLCFLAGTGKAAFLARHGGQGAEAGRIVDVAGETVGAHAGHQGFTVGQRRGIGVAGREPLYVLSTDAAANTVTVGPQAALATTRVRIRDLRLHGGKADRVKLRYRSRAVGCRIVGDDRLELSEPVDGAAPGQIACLMRGDEVVGTATIDSPAA